MFIFIFCIHKYVKRGFEAIVREQKWTIQRECDIIDLKHWARASPVIIKDVNYLYFHCLGGLASRSGSRKSRQSIITSVINIDLTNPMDQ